MRNEGSPQSPEPTVLIGRCTYCGEPFRAEIPVGRIVCTGYATIAAKGAGFPVSHDCRAGKPCQMLPSGFPECGNPWCDGHDLTEVKYKILKVTYKPEAICGPGNCFTARTAACTCSCRGANHAGAYAAGLLIAGF